MEVDLGGVLLDLCFVGRGITYPDPQFWLIRQVTLSSFQTFSSIAYIIKLITLQTFFLNSSSVIHIWTTVAHILTNYISCNVVNKEVYIICFLKQWCSYVRKWIIEHIHLYVLIFVQIFTPPQTKHTFFKTIHFARKTTMFPYCTSSIFIIRLPDIQ